LWGHRTSGISRGDRLGNGSRSLYARHVHSLTLLFSLSSHRLIHKSCPYLSFSRFIINNHFFHRTDWDPPHPRVTLLYLFHWYCYSALVFTSPPECLNPSGGITSSSHKIFLYRFIINTILFSERLKEFQWITDEQQGHPLCLPRNIICLICLSIHNKLQTVHSSSILYIESENFLLKSRGDRFHLLLLLLFQLLLLRRR